MSRCDQSYNNFYDDNQSSDYWGGCRPCPPKPHKCCCKGPTGATGAAGATILGSYETYAAFIAAHPTGTAGDAYLVGGVLYVWSAALGAWQSMGSLIGPTGATGAAGATILGSYETYAAFITAHPTGTAGDAYLVGGALYVWNAQTGAWQNMGSLIGPSGATGATGAAGATILGSYATLAELQAAHPTGTAGDAYLVGGELYVWNAETGAWQNMGRLIGPTGATGATGAAGATILGSYATLADLVAAHPTGTAGDAYLAGGELYVWNAETGAWQNMGSLVGPTGATGATGAVGTILDSYPTLADLEAAHPTGNQGDAYLVDGVLYVWDTTTNAWRAVGNLRPVTESATIIPFASQVAPLTFVNGGVPARVSLLGFGYGDRRGDDLLLVDNYAFALNSDNSFVLEGANDNLQLVFSLPFDMSIRSIALTAGNWAEYEPVGTVYPQVQLYAAEPTSNNFRAITDAVAIPETGHEAGIVPANTMLAALKEDLDIRLRAGTRIAIGALARIDGDTAAQNYYLYFTGGIGMTRWVE